MAFVELKVLKTSLLSAVHLLRWSLK